MAGYKASQTRDDRGRWSPEHPITFIAKSAKYGPVTGIEAFMDRVEKGARVTRRVLPINRLLATQETVSAKGLTKAGTKHAFKQFPGPLGLRNPLTGTTHLADGHHRVYKAHKSGERKVVVFTVNDLPSLRRRKVY